MSLSVLGLVRGAVVSAAGAGLVFAGSHITGAITVGAAEGADGTSKAASGAVHGAALVCPGPELVGVPGLRDLPVGVRVAAAAAPLRVLTGTQPSLTPGSVALTGMPGGALGSAATARAKVATSDLTKASGALATATQALAPGLAAAQSWLVSSGDQRSMGSTACTRPAADQWILAGGGAPGRQERLVLTNPGGNSVSVDVTLHGPNGPVQSANGKGVVVPAHGRTAFLLDSISGTLVSPAVHVVTQGGVVGAVVNDSWLNGTHSAGSDDASAAAPPSRDQVIPAVEVGGAAMLRVTVPGGREAVVQARVLTTQGLRALPGGSVVRVAGGSVRDIDISAIPPGSSALQVRADVPVVASVAFTRSGANGQSDFAWSVSTPPITGVAGLPFADFAPTHHAVGLAATGDSVAAEIVTVAPSGEEQSQRLTVPADSTMSVLLSSATSVWVHRVSGKGQLRAGVTSWVTDAQGTVLTSTPLLDSALRTTTVGLSEVQN